MIWYKLVNPMRTYMIFSFFNHSMVVSIWLFHGKALYPTEYSYISRRLWNTRVHKIDEMKWNGQEFCNLTGLVWCFLWRSSEFKFFVITYNYQIYLQKKKKKMIKWVQSIEFPIFTFLLLSSQFHFSNQKTWKHYWLPNSISFPCKLISQKAILHTQ